MTASDEVAIEWAFTPIGAAAERLDQATSLLSPRLSFIERLVGESGPGAALRTIELACLGRPRREPLTLLTARTSVPQEADRRLAEGWFFDEMRSALDDHAPVPWRRARQADRRAVETRRSYAHHARLRIGTPAGSTSGPEIYLLAWETIERALRRVRDPILLQVSLLLMPRLDDVPPVSLGGGPFGRLVAVGAPMGETPAPTHRLDAADRWRIFAKVELHSPRPIPPDVKNALAADIRGHAMLASGTAAAVDAEWDIDASVDTADADLERVGVTQLDLRESACLLGWVEGRAAHGSPAARLRDVPKAVPMRGIPIGRASGTNPRPVAIPPEALFEHLALVGGTGVGKSVTLAAILRSAHAASWARDGADPGRAQIWLFDPHGTTAASHAASAGPDEDVIYWDASDPGAHWDFFGSDDPVVRLRMVDPFVASQWEQWDPGRTNKLGMGPRAEAWLRAGGTAVASHPGATLADIHDLLTDEDRWRRVFRQWVTDPTTLGWFEMWWSSSAQRSNERAEFLSYFGSKTAVLSEAGMRRIWGKPGTGLNIKSAMRSGASVLLVVRRSDFGSVRTATLIRLMKHCLGPELTARDPNDTSVRPVIIATDEAAAYETQLDREWLAEMRKHRVGIILAFQDLLGQASPELIDSVAQNAAHLICWRSRSSPATMARLLGDPDVAPTLEKLGRGKAIARIAVGGEPQPPILIDTPKPVPFSKSRFDAVRAESRSRLETSLTCSVGSGDGGATVEDQEGTAGDPAGEAGFETLRPPLTETAVHRALRAVGVPAEVDEDGDILVDGVGVGRLWLTTRDGDVRLFTLRRCRPRSSHRARLALANRINARTKAVRVCVDPDSRADLLVVDWYLPSSVAYRATDLARAIVDFSNLLGLAHELDTEGVLAEAHPATRLEQ